MNKGLIAAFVAFLTVFSGCASHVPGANDNGLMSFCWRRDGRSDFRPNVCAAPRTFHWSEAEIPLTVHVASSDMILSEAIAQINNDVGCEVLVLEVGADSRYSADVMVILDEPFTVGEDRGIAATTFHRDAMGRVHAFVTLYALGLNSTLRFRALYHEFGHVLGLAHDTWHGSIMRPNQDDSLTGVVGFTDEDSSLLNSLYCH
jgi:hypothetical protein